MIKAVNIEMDEEALAAAEKVSEYCYNHLPTCKDCMFKFGNACILKCARPQEWKHSIGKILERRLQLSKDHES